METDLIFHHGLDLPEFAAFPLLQDEAGRRLLESYYRGYADIARRSGAGLLLETPTWRANPDWGRALGYDAEALRQVDVEAVTWLRRLARTWATDLPAVLVSGMIGPRDDGYAASTIDPAEAADYHRPQLAAFLEAGADLATALTLTSVGEATGVIRAAAELGIPVAVSFTVETDGALPDGTPLGTAVEAVDDATSGAASHFLVNCAHPQHIARALPAPGAGRGPDWTSRIAGLRVNASTLSHAELDEALELDEGDIPTLAAATRDLAASLPAVRIVGGCCGTDARHVAAMWGVEQDTPGAHTGPAAPG